MGIQGKAFTLCENQGRPRLIITAVLSSFSSLLKNKKPRRKSQVTEEKPVKAKRLKLNNIRKIKMGQTNTGILKIYYTDGSQMQIEYVREEEISNIATRIEKAIESNEVLIELEDRLLIVPLNNLKYIEVIPPPPKLPKFTIRNARLIQS